MILEALDTQKIYDLFKDKCIHNYLHSFLNVVQNTYQDTHPSEILIGYNFITQEQYREHMNEAFYKGMLKEVDVGLYLSLPEAEVFDLNKIKMLNENKDDLRSKISRLVSDYCILPFIIVDSEGIIFLVKEPETKKSAVYRASSGYNYKSFNIDVDDVSYKINLLTKQLGFRYNSFYFVDNITFFKACDMIRELTRTSYNCTLHKKDIKFITRKKVIDAVIDGASDIYLWGTKLGNEYLFESSITILNDNIPQPPIQCTQADLNMMKAEVWSWAGVDEAARKDYGLRDFNIENLILDVGNIRFTGRLNIMPDSVVCDKFNIRVNDTSKGIIPFANFKIDDKVKSELSKQLVYNDSGIIIVAGSTGSGKSTLIRSELDFLRQMRPTHRIESVEAPVEISMPGICQINIDDKNDLEPSDVIKALTRRNAKIVNLNEINTPELLKFAIDCSLMQLFLITTIHTTNVAFIPDRILGMLDADNRFLYDQFLNNVKVMVHLTMMKEACPKCCELVNVDNDKRISSEEIQVMNRYGYLQKEVYMIKEGIDTQDNVCPDCLGLGYLVKKPVVCVEYLIIDELVRRMLKRTEPRNMYNVIRKYMVSNGTTGIHDALKYLEQKVVTWEQIYKRFSIINILNEHLEQEQ